MRNQVLILLLNIIFCLSINAQNIRHLSVDIPGPYNFYTIQKNSNWCWAACNQMLLNSQGIPESQENQVIKIFGRLINKGAGNNYELARKALVGTYINAAGKSVKVTPYVSYLGTHSNDPIVIINSLKAGIPLVMATQMHGRVCVGIDFNTDGVNYQITSVRLLNPLNPSSIETIPMWYFLSMSFEGGLIGFMTFTIS